MIRYLESYLLGFDLLMLGFNIIYGYFDILGHLTKISFPFVYLLLGDGLSRSNIPQKTQQ